MDYPLEELGPEKFQHLCQALLLKEFPRFQCFPVAQPDGGRDAISASGEYGRSKFIVFQVKFVRKPLAEPDPHKWLMDIVALEAPKVNNLIPRGASRFVLLTNIPGTAHSNVGSIDSVNRELENAIGVPSECWWRDDLNRRLDGSWDIKWSYPEVMRGPDLLRSVIESGLSEHKERRESAIRAFLRQQFVLDEDVRFKQVELQSKLLDLFIDVPISFRDPNAEKDQLHTFKRLAINRQLSLGLDNEICETPDTRVATGLYVSRTSASSEKQLAAADLLLSQPMQRDMPWVVLEGAPGQGKSTISQFMCQVHRMRLLKDSTSLEKVKIGYRSGPLRLPIKVDLRDFATWIAKQNPFNVEDGDIPSSWSKSLESFLAALVSHQSGGTNFTTDDLLAIVRISSVLIVCDGLDEVADLGRRKDVVDEIVRGVQRLAENSASLQVVVTSRPAAFANSPGMPHEIFPHLQLDSLSGPIIMEYAERWVKAKQIDEKQASEFRTILKEKLNQPHLRDLARNPMQLTILLTLIHTKGSSLPDQRTALYEDYMSLFFDREAAKSSVVRDHRILLINLHRYLAWVLHSEAEEGNSRASISAERLHALVSDYLREEGHDTSLADELFTGMMERVVALVSRVEGTVEFEVQPLREFFAACHLYYTSPHSKPGKERRGSKPDRFDVISRNFYWLNVTRFFAGCYSKGEIPSLVDSLEELIRSETFSDTDYPHMLTAMLLSDWVFSQIPKSVKKVVDFALDAKGIRLLLAPHANRFRGAESPLSLPSKCGREELLATCFRLLRENAGGDFKYQLIEAIKGNSEDGSSIREMWLESYQAMAHGARVAWLDVGAMLGIVSVIPFDQLESIVTDVGQPEGAETFRVLFRAGRTDFIERSEESFNSGLDEILKGTAHVIPRFRGESVLQVVSQSLDPRRYARSFMERELTSLEDISRHYLGGVDAPTQVLDAVKAYDRYPACIEFIGISESESKRPAAEWATTLSPWEAIVECGRRAWGDRWAILVLANVAAGIRSNAETCIDAPDLSDESASLCRRVRYARLRSGGEKWWAKTLTEQRPIVERELCALVCLTWMKTSLLIALHDMLAEYLDGFAVKSWRRIFYAARNCRHYVSNYEGIKDPISSTVALPNKINERLAAVLLARDDTPSSADAVFKRSMRDLPLDDPIVREFAMIRAADLARFGSQEWKPDLRTVEEAYRHGPSMLPYLGTQRRGIAIPLSTAKVIARRPLSFPSEFVEVAEGRIRAEATKRVRPVAQLATEERWFEEED